MLNSQTNPEPIQEILPHGPMTMEEFLENDLEGYEYVKGALVLKPPGSIIQGLICSNVCLYLASYVRLHQLGGVYSFITLLNYEDTLTGKDVVEGFSCAVAEFFE